MKFTKFIKPELEQIKCQFHGRRGEDFLSSLPWFFTKANIHKRKSITKNDRVQSERYKG